MEAGGILGFRYDNTTPSLYVGNLSSACTEHVGTPSASRTYQLSLPSYELVVLDSAALDNRSHTVTATGNRGMSRFVVYEGW